MATRRAARVKAAEAEKATKLEAAEKTAAMKRKKEIKDAQVEVKRLEKLIAAGPGSITKLKETRDKETDQAAWKKLDGAVVAANTALASE